MINKGGKVPGNKTIKKSILDRKSNPPLRSLRCKKIS